MSLEELRRQYTMGGLDESMAPAMPLDLFAEWMQSALDNAPADWVEPYAMTLATSTSDGLPTARVVLLRGFDEAGFVFYTNYESQKGAQIESNPHAALVFYWGYLERQVRITGSISRVSRDLSKTYFHKRPRGSQISASVSRQSVTVSGRDELEAKVNEFAASVGEQEVPLPDFWGGYRLQPAKIEFWQGRQNRLHDRLEYILKDGAWELRRLSP